MLIAGAPAVLVQSTSRLVGLEMWILGPTTLRLHLPLEGAEVVPHFNPDEDRRTPCYGVKPSEDCLCWTPGACAITPANLSTYCEDIRDRNVRPGGFFDSWDLRTVAARNL